jgi:hypothetical protein
VYFDDRERKRDWLRQRGLPADRRPDKGRRYVRCLRRVILLSVTATSVTAYASEKPTERARVALQYERGGTAVKACPNEATFRGLVAARLGYEPFVDESALALLVVLRQQGGVVEGRLELTARGEPRGERAMSSALGDCYELAASLALAAAVAIDPEGVRAQTTAPEPKAAPPPARPPPQPAEQPTPAPAAAPPITSPRGKTALGALLEAGALFSWGLQPGLAPGVRLGGGLGGLGGGWSVGLEVAAFLPSAREREYAAVSSHALYGSLLPCLHPGSARFTVDVCAALSLGVLFSDAQGVMRSQPVADRYTTVGARLAFTFMVSDSVGFGLDAEAPVALPRVHLLVDDAGVTREAWATSRVGFIGGARVVLKLR